MWLEMQPVTRPKFVIENGSIYVWCLKPNNINIKIKIKKKQKFIVLWTFAGKSLFIQVVLLKITK
jgi:hypothetical protein